MPSSLKSEISTAENPRFGVEHEARLDGFGVDFEIGALYRRLQPYL
jgi:hypothetical protein